MVAGKDKVDAFVFIAWRARSLYVKAARLHSPDAFCGGRNFGGRGTRDFFGLLLPLVFLADERLARVAVLRFEKVDGAFQVFLCRPVRIYQVHAVGNPLVAYSADVDVSGSAFHERVVLQHATAVSAGLVVNGTVVTVARRAHAFESETLLVLFTGGVRACLRRAADIPVVAGFRRLAGADDGGRVAFAGAQGEGDNRCRGKPAGYFVCILLHDVSPYFTHSLPMSLSGHLFAGTSLVTDVLLIIGSRSTSPQ